MQDGRQPDTATKLRLLKLSPVFWDARGGETDPALSPAELEAFAARLTLRSYEPGEPLAAPTEGLLPLQLIVRGVAVQTHVGYWSRQPQPLRAGSLHGAAGLTSLLERALPAGEFAGVRAGPWVGPTLTRTTALTRVETLCLRPRDFAAAFPALHQAHGSQRRASPLLARLLELAEIQRRAPEIVRALGQTPELRDVEEAFLFELLWGARLREVEAPDTIDAQRSGQGFDVAAGLLLPAGVPPAEYFYVLSGTLRYCPVASLIAGPDSRPPVGAGGFAGLGEVLRQIPLPQSVFPAQSCLLVALRAAVCRRLLETEGEFRAAIRANVAIPERFSVLSRRATPDNPDPCQVILLAPHPAAHQPPRASFPALAEALGRRIQTHLRDNVLVVHGGGSRGPGRVDAEAVQQRLRQAVHRLPPRTGESAASPDLLEPSFASFPSAEPSELPPPPEGVVQAPLSFAELLETLRTELAQPERSVPWDVILIDAAEVTAEPLELIGLIGEPPGSAGEGPLAPLTDLALVSDHPAQRAPSALFEFQVDVLTLAAMRVPIVPRGPLQAATRTWNALSDPKYSLALRATMSWAAGLRSSLENSLFLAERSVEGLQRAWSDVRTGLDTRPTWPLGTARLSWHEDEVIRLEPEARKSGHDPLDSSPDPLVRGLDAWARTITRRRVGLALGGGGAQGYVHHELVQKLTEANVPIDVVSGTSAGAMYGAYYATLGLEGLALAREHWWLMSLFLPLSICSNRILEWIVWADLGSVRLHELEQTFLPTSTNADTGKEWNFRRGWVASTTRASGSFPPMAPAIIGAASYLDGAFAANVPTRVLDDEGACLRIASNPMLPIKRRYPRGPFRMPFLRLWLRQWNLWARAQNVLRGQKMLMRNAGQVDASSANVVAYTVQPAHYSASSWWDAKQIMADAGASEDLRVAVASAANRWLLGLGGPCQRLSLFRWDPRGRQGPLQLQLSFHFPAGAPKLDAFGRESLKTLASFLQREHLIGQVTIWADPGPLYGEPLAKARADSVRNRLVASGVQPQRLALFPEQQRPSAAVQLAFRRGEATRTDLVFEVTKVLSSTGISVQRASSS